MRLMFAHLCAVASLIFLSDVVLGQESTSATDTAGSGVAALADADTVLVPVWPKASVALPDTQEAVATSFALGAIDGVDPALIAGVTANGYARKVAVEDQAIGQVLVTSVAKGEREEVISTEGLSAQFDAADTSELFPEKSLTVEGSKAALIAALEKLNAEEEADDTEKTVTDETSENAVGTTGGGNDMASDYTTPTTTTTTEEEEDPTITVSTTTSGCDVRIDTAQGKAIQQSKEQTFSDGVLGSETACTDSEVSFVLKQSYLSCPDIVDTDAMTAWPQYTLYYVDAAGETHTVSECTRDTETPYTIAEDEDACGIFLDFETGQAVPQSALVYTNRTGATVQARGCDTSTLSESVAMTESADACSLRHDFAAGLSYELSMWTYVRNGVTYQASSCSDTGRTFAHETVYTDTLGEYVCTPVVNLTDNTVTLQSRKRITIDGVSQYITECTPDTATQSILATTDGCMDPSAWTHDVDAGVSYGQERFYYLKGGTTPVYVTACQTSDATYIQDRTITGYQVHDAQLYAYALTTVTIDVGGSAYTIKSSEVLPGAPRLVYVPDGTVDRKTGESTYEGCDAYYTTTRYEQWERPDGTIYEKAIGDGDAVGPTDVCSTELVDEKEYVTGATASLQANGTTTCGGGSGENTETKYSIPVYHTYGTSMKSRLFNRDTDETISYSYAWKNGTASLRSQYAATNSMTCGSATTTGWSSIGCSTSTYSSWWNMVVYPATTGASCSILTAAPEY